MVIVRSPVRISFGGGGTDIGTYYNRYGGCVLSAAITRYCSVMAHRPSDGGIHITSADYDLVAEAPAGQIPRVEEPLSLPKAAIARFASYGIHQHGVDLFLTSEVAPGTGLGSSSAMACALVGALANDSNEPLNPATVADLACSLEIDYLGMPIGKQDQYASAFGGLNVIEFTTAGVTVTPLWLSGTTLEALSRRLLLFSTGRSRQSASILGQQRADSAGDPAVIDSLHRLKAIAWDMIAALSDGRLDTFGGLLDRGWQEKKRLSSRISTGAIDEWYNAARAAGALGGKITGAGGGGHLLLYCPPEHQALIRATMHAFGLTEVPFGFDMTGTQVVCDETPVQYANRMNGAEAQECIHRLVDESARTCDTLGFSGEEMVEDARLH
jgi:D-glycero-alpha-D-manno-heptose-7-phosphate kinase